MSSPAKIHSEPPEAPTIQRKFHLYGYQYLCIPFLFLVPILAMFGFIGESTLQAQHSNESLGITIEYPARQHYQGLKVMSIEIQNKTETNLDSVIVSISKNYLEKFSSVSILPDVTEITEDSYKLNLENMAAGETRTIRLELEAEVYGEHIATVTAASEQGEPVQLTIKTFVFP